MANYSMLSNMLFNQSYNGLTPTNNFVFNNPTFNQPIFPGIMPYQQNPMGYSQPPMNNGFNMFSGFQQLISLLNILTLFSGIGNGTTNLNPNAGTDMFSYNTPNTGNAGIDMLSLLGGIFSGITGAPTNNKPAPVNTELVINDPAPANNNPATVASTDKPAPAPVNKPAAPVVPANKPASTGSLSMKIMFIDPKKMDANNDGKIDMTDYDDLLNQKKDACYAEIVLQQLTPNILMNGPMKYIKDPTYINGAKYDLDHNQIIDSNDAQVSLDQGNISQADQILKYIIKSDVAYFSSDEYKLEVKRGNLIKKYTNSFSDSFNKQLNKQLPQSSEQEKIEFNKLSLQEKLDSALAAFKQLKLKDLPFITNNLNKFKVATTQKIGVRGGHNYGDDYLYNYNLKYESAFNKRTKESFMQLFAETPIEDEAWRLAVEKVPYSLT